MPHFKNVAVHVTDQDGNKFEEWGVHYLRNQSKVSAYIMSSNDMPFQLAIKPKIPFLNVQRKDGFSMSEKLDPDLHNSESNDIRLAEGSLASSKISKSFEHASKKMSQREKHLVDLMEEDCESSYQNNDADLHYQSSLPFHLLASLYLDGREEPERRVIVYLDPEHEDFAFPEGKVKFKRRCVQGKDGTIKELCWIFRDLGMENVLDRMCIGEPNETGQSAEETENSMVDLMGSADLGAEKNIQKEELSNLGQIRVVLQRVGVGKRLDNKFFVPNHREDENEDIDMDEISKDITHTTGFEYASTSQALPSGVVNFWPYVPGEPPYATFKFFYRSQATLEKFNFLGFPQSTKPPRKTRRQLNNELSNLTPLSIAHPIQSSKWKGSTFDDRIREKSFDSKSEPKYNFGGEYREVAVKDKKATRRQQELLTSHSHLVTDSEKSDSHSLSGEKINTEPQQCDQKGTTDRANSLSSEISTISSIVEESTSKSGSNAISPRATLALNQIPKIYPSHNQESDADDEQGPDEEIGSEDENDSLTQDDDNVLDQNSDDDGLHTKFNQVAMCKKRRWDEESSKDHDENLADHDPTKATAGSLSTDHCIIDPRPKRSKRSSQELPIPKP